MVDSPSITTRSVRDDERGYDAGKHMQGRKRHLVVETQGVLMSVNVLAADRGDREGGKVVLLPHVGMLPRLQVIGAESGENGAPCEPWVKASCGVRLEMVTHPWTGRRGVWAN